MTKSSELFAINIIACRFCLKYSKYTMYTHISINSLELTVSVRHAIVLVQPMSLVVVT